MMLRVAAKNRQGQTLIIAIMVMFILAMVAAVFIALVARNLTRSERMSNADAISAIAEAGIRYADEQLTTGEDGADWRPTPDNLALQTQGVWSLNPAERVNPVPVADWKTTIADLDPDFQWVRSYWPVELGFAGPSGGYTRLSFGQGRFLLRVSYNPDPKVPSSKFIKIESVGRYGIVLGDVNNKDKPTKYDPTTFVSSRLRREITAFKPIGITDSCRFITNKDNRSIDVALGVPGYTVNFGRADKDVDGLDEATLKSKYGVRGGPIRVNANLLWYGEYGSTNPSVNIFLRGIQGDGPTGDPEFLPIDGVEVAGDIKVDSDPSDDTKHVKVRLHELIRGSDGVFTENRFDVFPSDDPGFTTCSGFYRDGQNGVDQQNVPRRVKRIEAPLVDQSDSTNTTMRYRVLTQNSGERIGGVNTGNLGWGKGVYINNINDKQDESETLFGGVTARADYMQPGNMMTTNWKGPYYVPPAAVINLVPDDYETINNKKQYYFTITRSDTRSGLSAVWSDPDGNPRLDWGSTVRMPYPDAENGRTLVWYEPGHTTPTQRRIAGNGVIYAEGNIRIRGMLPPGMRLTVVSNQNIYIDGSVLKNRPSNTTINPSGNYRGADSKCGIALLARQNVVVNTTQFFAPLNNIGADDVGSDSLTGGNSSHVIVRNDPGNRMRCRFDFAPYESEEGNAPSNWYLFLRHSGEYGPAYINAWLNPTDTATNWGILNLNMLSAGTPVFAGLPPHVWGVGDPRYGFGATPPGAGVGSAFACNVFDLSIVGGFTNGIPDLLQVVPGAPNILQIALDQASYTRGNYWMGGMAVVPMDVRIEAILYAQEGSFYVIPGYWLNPNPADTDPANRPPGVDKGFPLYGEAPDIRIIVDGAVSENVPASISDVREWMAKWGTIPRKYGSSAIDTAHPLEGITFLYDDHVGWPLDDDRNPVRKDAYGRALPLTPRLPVSTSLVYFGDVL